MSSSTESGPETISARFTPLDDLAVIEEVLVIPDLVEHLADDEGKQFLERHSAKYGWDQFEEDERPAMATAIEDDASEALDRLRAYFGDEAARERLRRNGNGPVENPYA